MTKFLLKFFLLILFSLTVSGIVTAQPQKILNAAELQNSIEKLKVLGSVLYIAAHPDDENTSLMAFLSKGKKYRTGYLSLTRGDGGQNLIGSEKGVEIGILRTQELLQARKIDGAEQFFSRAIDFGYSKSPEETLEIWNKEEILKDVVWVIRSFKPDVIVTRFPVGSSGGHGHHTSSALIAAEAFRAAADSTKFTEQLKYVEPWQTKRIFWNNWRPSAGGASNLISVDVGEYNSGFGKSYTELGAESRSMHKSQGFGASAFRGSRIEYFKYVDGDSAENNIFDGIDIRWHRIHGTGINDKIESIIKNFNSSNPSEIIPRLIVLYDEMNKLEKDYWVEIKKQELLNIIKSCAGLWIEAVATDYSASPGDEINITTTLVNRSKYLFNLDKINFSTVHTDSILNKAINFNQPLIVGSKIKIPEDYPISQPYWLEEESSKGLFKVTNVNSIGMSENRPSILIKVLLELEGQQLEYKVPLLYRWNDRVDGELYRPFEVRPPVTTNIMEKVAIFSDDKSKEIQIRLKSNSANIDGSIEFQGVDGWIISPATIPFKLNNKYDEKLISFSVTPPKNPGETNLKISLLINGKRYNKSLVEITHPHIASQVYFPQSELKLVKLDIEKTEGKIGYIVGSGDEIPECLTNMGYDVTLISDEMLESNNLVQYDAIITGVRAYNTRERLKFVQPKLLKYAEAGGTLIVQYNVAFGLVTQDIGPYPFRLSQDRITDEEAILNFIDPKNEILNFPNKISEKDFEGWVQERGLYFADQWDGKYATIFSGHDKNENELKGSTLFTRYGKGVFIYTGLSWFRQLPAGVPGAYRIFANMVSAGKYDKAKNK